MDFKFKIFSQLFEFWYGHSRLRLNRCHLIVITGCDSGLGYAVATRCSTKHGSYVLAGVVDKNGSGARSLAQHEGIKVLQLDVTDQNSRRQFAMKIESLVRNDGLKFYALVNNAAVMVFGLYDWLLPQHIECQYNVNLLGPQLLTRDLAILIREQGTRLINVTSHCAKSALPGLSVYGSTKAAIEAWTDSLRIEFKNYSARAVTFVPGSFFMESNIMANQSEYFDQMYDSMSPETKIFYGNYFKEYREHLEPLAIKKRHDLLKDEKLLSTFDGALLDKVTRAEYKCEPLRYKIYHTLFKIVPLLLRDWLVERFMRMPKFKR